MSDDKLIKRSAEIAPVDDFAKRVEEELRRRGEEPAQRSTERECWAACKIETNNIARCRLKPGHVGSHRNGIVFWSGRCSSTVQGEQCRYQDKHVGTHVDVREKMSWTDDKPAVAAKDDSSFEVLGEMLQGSGTFQQAIAKRVAQSVPILQKVPFQKTRRWLINFGPEAIPAGQRVTLMTQMDVLFRGEKLINTGDEDGLYIENIFVGARAQRSGGNSTSVMTFRSTAPGSEIMMDTVSPGLSIAIVVRNAAKDTRTFAASIIGKAVL